MMGRSGSWAGSARLWPRGGPPPDSKSIAGPVQQFKKSPAVIRPLENGRPAPSETPVKNEHLTGEASKARVDQLNRFFSRVGPRDIGNDCCERTTASMFRSRELRNQHRRAPNPVFSRPRASPIPPPAMSSRCALRRAVETASRVSSRVAGDHLAASCGVSSRARRMSSAASSVADVAGDDDGWETIVGLELHVQLALDTKLFSGCVRATAVPISARLSSPVPPRSLEPAPR